MNEPAKQTTAPGKSRSKNIVVVAFGLVILCLIAGFWAVWVWVPSLSQTVIVDPKQVAIVAKQIADYQLPAGFSERSATVLPGATTVMISDASDESTIWFGQGPTNQGLSPDEFRQTVTITKYSGVQWVLSSSRPVMIRGQNTTLSVYDGSGADNQTYYAWSAQFMGKGGYGSLLIVGPAATWSDEEMRAFVDSLR